MREITEQEKHIIETDSKNTLAMATVINQFLGTVDLNAMPIEEFRKIKLGTTPDDHAYRCEYLGIPNTYVELPEEPTVQQIMSRLLE